MKKLKFCAFEFFKVFILSFSLVSLVIAQNSKISDHDISSRRNTLLERTKLIDEELKQPDNPEWAGLYHWGHIGFVGSILRIAPRSGFVYQIYSDTPTEETRNTFDFGKIDFDEGTIRFHSNLNFLNNRKFFPIKWGNRNLLVPEDRLLILIGQHNAGCAEALEYRKVVQLLFPTKNEEIKLRLFGIPNVPAEFEKFILKKPISAKLVGIIENRLEKQKGDRDIWYSQYTTISLNIGSESGVWKGMKLYSQISGSDYIYLTAEITKVNSETAEAEIYRSVKGKKAILPQIGIEFSSRLSDSVLNYRLSPSDCS